MTKAGNKIKQIDIANIINESNSELLKKLPGFVVRLIARIIMQDEINRILEKYSDNIGPDFLTKIIEELNLKLEIEGSNNLPENRKCFFVANHPYGVIDGLILTHIVSEKYGPLKAIGNEAFMFLPQMRPLIAAVNVYGPSSKEYVKALEETYNMNIPITHFPAGEVSRRYNGKVQDSTWQKSFITKAVTSKRDIVPFYFYGRNSRLFYIVYMVRQLFKIKINIELMLLPRELFRMKNKTIKVKIGKTIQYHMFDKSLSHWDWAQKVRSLVYELGSDKLKNIN